MDSDIDILARREKRTAALSSVIAAVGLTAFKIIVGVSTGSLGILAEAAHSALDLIAAIITFFAIRISVIPADSSHLYGHGKVENISALFETLLLLVTCVWIIYEAIQRLFFKTVAVEATAWSFIVMAVSIAVDYSRSRVLYRAARKHRSQALEADALHFSTDIWSSGVVIFGLICVKIAELNPGLFALEKADALAALIVAVIVIYVSIRLGARTVQALVDAAPRGLYRKIKKIVEAQPGVINCHNIRVRYSGPQIFIDVHILTDGGQTLKRAHELTMKIEKAVQEMIPNADIMVHPEPVNEE
ncbi:MAG: cation transporter [Spirochaetes bacterium RBG_16_49_21]|nr:MAG: cation transporter [Spirochaetes bacterium RBG_16_49_21]